ncbi:hypothetical protein ACR80S_14595 [Halomonas sp. MA07-2]|uniref:hypothetical protein n=1 Tax=Halomonas sp. MA07-2 TaxID=3440841 RepID=UPI003EEF5988
MDTVNSYSIKERQRQGQPVFSQHTFGSQRAEGVGQAEIMTVPIRDDSMADSREAQFQHYIIDAMAAGG